MLILTLTMLGGGLNGFKATCDTVKDFLNQDWVSLEISVKVFGIEFGISNSRKGGIDTLISGGGGKAKPDKIGFMINIYSPSVNYSTDIKKIKNKTEALQILNKILEKGMVDTNVIKDAIKFWEKKDK